jgi:DUF1680 family protein
VAALTGEEAYISAIDRIWENVVGKKMHLTGGIGARRDGEAFGANYELPNDGAYLETCAAIANALWNERMFLLHGDAKYVDVLERVIYNGFLSGVALTGDRFFYPNPLESDGKAKFNQGSCERAQWFGCSCCPVNDVRFIPEIASFIYALRTVDIPVRSNGQNSHGSNRSRTPELFVNLYIGSIAKVELGGRSAELLQTTGYPWDGKVELKLVRMGHEEDRGQKAENSGQRSEAGERSLVTSAAIWTLALRIPGWARNRPVPSDLYRYDDDSKPGLKLTLNGKTVKPSVENGFARITRRWKEGDVVRVEMEMPVRRVVANPLVKADVGRFAIERGPLVYCAEGADNGGNLLNWSFLSTPKFFTEYRPELLGGIMVVKATGLYDNALECIPYYAWCHRGPNEMRVWFPEMASR